MFFLAEGGAGVRGKAGKIAERSGRGSTPRRVHKCTEAGAPLDTRLPANGAKILPLRNTRPTWRLWVTPKNTATFSNIHNTHHQKDTARTISSGPNLAASNVDAKAGGHTEVSYRQATWRFVVVPRQVRLARNSNISRLWRRLVFLLLPTRRPFLQTPV